MGKVNLILTVDEGMLHRDEAGHLIATIQGVEEDAVQQAIADYHVAVEKAAQAETGV